MQNRNILYIALLTAFILLIPLAAMQFTNEVNWGPIDFVVAGVLLFGTGLAYELVSKKMGRTKYRAAIGVALAAGLFLIWSNLAVGLIGSENESANLMYYGVLAVGGIGAFLSRFQPRGMARAMLATAVGFVLITAIALIAGMQHYPESSVTEIVGVNAFFVLLFALSAALFERASAADPA